MHQINEALRKRVQEAMAKSGWHFRPDQADMNTVRCWFYSVSLQRGPRLISQLSVETYRSVLKGDGIVAQTLRSRPGIAPADLFLSAVAEFDSYDPAKQAESHDHLTAFIATYARVTQTWGLAKPLSEVPGVHFVAFDWKTDKNLHVVRPGLAYQATPLRPEQLAEMATMQLSLHLARYPHEFPAGC